MNNCARFYDNEWQNWAEQSRAINYFQRNLRRTQFYRIHKSAFSLTMARHVATYFVGNEVSWSLSHWSFFLRQIDDNVLAEKLARLESFAASCARWALWPIDCNFATLPLIFSRDKIHPRAKVNLVFQCLLYSSNQDLFLPDPQTQEIKLCPMQFKLTNQRWAQNACN